MKLYVGLYELTLLVWALIQTVLPRRNLILRMSQHPRSAPASCYAAAAYRCDGQLIRLPNVKCFFHGVREMLLDPVISFLAIAP